MANDKGESLKGLLTSLKNVSARLFLTSPVLVLVFLASVWLAFYYLGQSENKMTFLLCGLVSFVSILIYFKTKSYGETLLTFMLGVLTVFTIQWTTYSSILFFSFYIGFNAVIFMISTISISSKIEDELTAAAIFINLKNHKSVYKELQATSRINTQFNSLGPLNRAYSLKFMAYMKIPVVEMLDGLKNIEYIKVIYQIEIEKACDIFRVLYFIVKRTDSEINVTDFLNAIVERKIPLTPSELFTIVGRTKGTIIRKKLSVHDYLDEVENLVSEGYEEEEIIAQLNNSH